MRYLALVTRISPLIEEEVTLVIQGIEFTGFASVCPYEIEVGQVYPVIIGFTILDEIQVHEIQGDKQELEYTGVGYQHYIRGRLYEKAIEAGMVISDEDEYFENYPDLIGKYVEVKVDRISIEFLRE